MTESKRTPSGEYPRAMPIHHLDLNAAAETLLSRLPGTGRQSQNIARESGVSLVLMAMEEGDTLKEHSAPGVVSVHVMRGGGSLSSDSEAFELSAGQAVLMQPGVRHDFHAREQSVLLLTITGAR